MGLSKREEICYDVRRRNVVNALCLWNSRRKSLNMTVLKAEDMMCDHCVERINNGLEDEGIQVEVDLSEKTVYIDGDDKDVEKAKDILGDLGFFAEEI